MGQIAGRDVDSGYAWVIVFASFALHFQQVNTCVAVFCTYYLQTKWDHICKILEDEVGYF